MTASFSSFDASFSSFSVAFASAFASRCATFAAFASALAAFNWSAPSSDESIALPSRLRFPVMICQCCSTADCVLPVPSCSATRPHCFSPSVATSSLMRSSSSRDHRGTVVPLFRDRFFSPSAASSSSSATTATIASGGGIGTATAVATGIGAEARGRAGGAGVCSGAGAGGAVGGEGSSAAAGRAVESVSASIGDASRGQTQ
mmetsp:Transcript_6329/g.15955  ORF Transcript_6329/g.15955 Transcript_6329/m.15955 type:complete len:203 (-) Transcript_6329:3-611(-)